MTTLRIETTDFKAKWLSRIASAFGATVKEETVPKQSLREVIDEAEADFANGRSKTFTVAELETLFDERA